MTAPRTAASLFDPPQSEPSRLTAFAGNTLDRRSEARPEGCLQDALRHKGALAYAVAEGRLILSTKNPAPQALFRLDDLAPFAPDPEKAVLLGFAQGEVPRLAVPVAADPDALPPYMSAIDFRSLYTQALLPPSLLGEVAQGASLLAWNASARFCGRCGSLTRSECGGYRRSCTACARQYFPRTDPVVIMLAVDEGGDRCLLGRSPHFRPGMFSCLAGFLEPGETIEDAVRRETLEESGIVLGRIRYHASQPWPFPHSLMIGCYGEALTVDIRYDARELEDCRWFSRAEACEMLARPAGEGYTVPPEGSIAHRLITDWSLRRIG